MSGSDENKKLQNQDLPKQVEMAVVRLANNPDLNIVLTHLKNDYILQLVSTTPDEKEMREECYTKHMALDDFETWLKNVDAIAKANQNR